MKTMSNSEDSKSRTNWYVVETTAPCDPALAMFLDWSNHLRACFTSVLFGKCYCEHAFRGAVFYKRCGSFSAASKMFNNKIKTKPEKFWTIFTTASTPERCMGFWVYYPIIVKEYAPPKPCKKTIKKKTAQKPSLFHQTNRVADPRF